MLDYKQLNETASACFQRLDGERNTFMTRMERLSQLTLPSVLPDEEFNRLTDQLTNGSSSLGSQCVTHLDNKLMTAMFNPSRPFFRLALPANVIKRMAAQLGVEEGLITDSLAQGERDAMAELEREGCREALYEGIAHLICIGNTLMCLDEDEVVFISLRDYVVKRNYKGVVVKLIIRYRVRYCDLDPEAQAIYTSQGGSEDEECVETYRMFKLEKGMYRESYWIKDKNLGQKYAGKYTIENMPYRALTWRLPLGQDYGVGRCEEYANDLGAYDEISEAMLNGAILASQFKWLANPAGMTRPELLTNSPNGAILPGVKEDLNLVYANIGQQLQTVQAVSQEYQRRLGAGFLLSSAVTRDAERVTAEEIRIQALELEGSLGGVYSRLALSIQAPLARWLLKRAKVQIKGTQIKPVVITGLDALSRNGELDRMNSFLMNLASLDQLQPTTRQKLNENNIISDIAAGNGVDKGKYVLTEAQQQANASANTQAALAVQGAQNAVDAATQPSEGA